MKTMEGHDEDCYGHDMLHGFDLSSKDEEFLASVICSGITSHDDIQQLLDQSLFSGVEDWNNLIECAKSIRKLSSESRGALEGHDLSAYLWGILRGTVKEVPLEPWHETDRLIRLAQQLEAEQPDLRHLLAEGPAITPGLSRPPSSTLRTRTPQLNRAETSNYWLDETGLQDHRDAARQVFLERLACNRRKRCSPNQSLLSAAEQARFPEILEDNLQAATSDLVSSNVVGRVSHFFSPPKSKTSKSGPNRRVPGIVSCLPFPPLTASSFGLIQEKFAHEPFWLLVAVTFLIKTKGEAAIPVFYTFKDRFPSPAHVADPANRKEIMDMIQHLGLCTLRIAFLQNYANGFLQKPPCAGKVYRVRGYDRRDPESLPDKPSFIDFENFDGGLALPGTEGDKDAGAWEIGHMTNGKYSLDSWRIFCRDELLGRAEDWNGKGREPEFQPEWMRVMPQDKELRAYLRWMWMREGWDWDPVTGRRTVLRVDLQRAVNEGRVEYDDVGGLRILDKIQPDL